ncbi:MAG: AbrB/MazE/SpoVT family DNA-binding domain-containing protein [Patescibacteria group bacterium]
MKEMIVGTKNQIVIPKEVRQKVKDLGPGKKVMIYSLDDETIIIKVESTDWLNDNYGAMKKIWKNVDPSMEVKKMRKEWI